MDTITDPFVEEQKQIQASFLAIRNIASRFQAAELQYTWERNDQREVLLNKLFKAQDRARDYLVNFPEDLEELTLKLAAEKDGFE